LLSCPFTVWRQYFLPQQLLTRFAGKLAHCQIPWFKNWAIRRFVRLYPINLTEALEPRPENYPSFHHFFIRQLRSDCRPIDSSPDGICSPCDGTVSQIAPIKQNTLLQAKGRIFTLEALLGDHTLARSFINGHYATIYLAPQDYHRIHMPCAGTLQHLHYIPGKLFSVNPLTANHVDNLFARNERAIAVFKHPHGSFAMILVGAMIVGSIFTRWSGYLTPHRKEKILRINYPETPSQHISLDKGEEMGYFSIGSTVILLFGEKLQWEQSITPCSRVMVGQRIGRFFQ
jgi:phosphatidylserine decarboxylase